jgi:hypothetical protein
MNSLEPSRSRSSPACEWRITFVSLLVLAEVVDFSEQDGSLSFIAQIRVALAPGP